MGAPARRRFRPSTAAGPWATSYSTGRFASPVASIFTLPPASSAIGPAYLGGQYAPFATFGDPNRPETAGGQEVATDGRLASRRALLGRIDRRTRDRSAELVGEFQRQALDIPSQPHVRRAFDLEREPAALRDRYGRTAWGSSARSPTGSSRPGASWSP